MSLGRLCFSLTTNINKFNFRSAPLLHLIDDVIQGNKTKMAEPVCVADFENHARKFLPKSVYDFVAFGATELQTVHDNVQAFSRYV